MSESKTHHIQPYHMNGLNWRLVEDNDVRDNIVVVTGFMPAWWEAEYGITFPRKFHLDATTHRDTLAQMEAILQERFGDLPNFFCGDDYAHSCPIERRYGDALIPAMFGGRVSFEDASGHPYAETALLSDEEATALTVPEVDQHPVLAALLDERPSGLRTTGELGFEGVINIAYKLRGAEMFHDMLLNPELLHHVFDVVWETIDRTIHRVRDWQNPGHTRPSHFVTCDCLVNMISGKMYREQLLEFDKRFRESFDLFGIHTCNWTVDPYLKVIAEIDDLAYLDMGPKSDLDLVHELFPSLRPSVFFHPETFKRLSQTEIKREISELSRRIGKGYILLSDMEAGTEDSQIRAAYEAASRF